MADRRKSPKKVAEQGKKLRKAGKAQNIPQKAGNGPGAPYNLPSLIGMINFFMERLSMGWE